MFPRFLSPAEKRKRLRLWRRRCCAPRPPGDLGGRGFPDADIIPWCARLNAIAGVCTLQSCAGHGRVGPRGGRVNMAAHLWLKLDRRMNRWFDRRVFILAHAPTIECIARRYLPGEGEIVEIVFHGNERGQLARSMQTIVAFCRQLRRRARAKRGYLQSPSFSFARHSSQNSPLVGTIRRCS